jgi:hypothetical protein
LINSIYLASWSSDTVIRLLVYYLSSVIPSFLLLSLRSWISSVNLLVYAFAFDKVRRPLMKSSC